MRKVTRRRSSPKSMLDPPNAMDESNGTFFGSVSSAPAMLEAAAKQLMIHSRRLSSTLGNEQLSTQQQQPRGRRSDHLLEDFSSPSERERRRSLDSTLCKGYPSPLAAAGLFQKFKKEYVSKLKEEQVTASPSSYGKPKLRSKKSKSKKSS